MTAIVVITPALGDEGATVAARSLAAAHLLPFLPPREQQALNAARAASASQTTAAAGSGSAGGRDSLSEITSHIFAGKISVLPESAAVPGGSLRVGSGVMPEADSTTTTTLAPLASVDSATLGPLVAAAIVNFKDEEARKKKMEPHQQPEQQLPPHGGQPSRSDVEDASEEHGVVQGTTPAAAVGILRSRYGGTGSAGSAMMLEFAVRYSGRQADEPACCLLSVPAGLTGLQLKSAVIAALGLKGGFQDYYLTLGGAPFGSRSALGAHPGLLHIAAGLGPAQQKTPGGVGGGDLGPSCTSGAATGAAAAGAVAPVLFLDMEPVAGRQKAVGHT